MAQWEASVKDIADLGMRYLVLMAVALGNRAFYNTSLLPRDRKVAAPDPIEALLTAGDRYGVKFFISCEWYGPLPTLATLNAPDAVRARLQMMGELAEQYGHHESFYGWYWTNESYLAPYFVPEFVEYINTCSHEGRQLIPRAKTLTAPYYTHKAVYDDRFVRQLEKLDIDIIAYQDEVGCLRMTPDQSARAFATLRKAHDKVPQRKLWADVELFTWEGEPNKPDSPLIPAPFSRVQKQLEAVGPYVETILVYQYQGLMNNPASKASVGHPDAVKLYHSYRAWLKKHHPDSL